MAKISKIEITAQLGVDTAQDVHVKRGGHPLGIVIGSVQDCRVFLKVDTDDKAGAAAQKRSGVP